MTASPLPDVTAGKHPYTWRRIPLSLRMCLFLFGLLGLACLWMLGTDALRQFNFRRIAEGMTQADVEACLGPPNPLPDQKRQNRALWDTHIWFGSKYVTRSVHYDVNGKVDETAISKFWRVPIWWESMRRAF